MPSMTGIHFGDTGCAGCPSDGLTTRVSAAVLKATAGGKHLGGPRAGRAGNRGLLLAEVLQRLRGFVLVEPLPITQVGAGERSIANLVPDVRVSEQTGVGDVGRCALRVGRVLQRRTEAGHDDFSDVFAGRLCPRVAGLRIGGGTDEAGEAACPDQ